MPTLALIRHGQSQWNLENRFTGWVDVDLTDQGRAEATLFLRRRFGAASQRLARLVSVSLVFVQLVLEGRRVVIKGSTAALVRAAASQKRQFEAWEFQLSSPRAC